MKKSAIEWLEDIMMVNGFIIPLTLFEQAKEMEQDQMAKQYKKGFDEGTELLYKEVRRIYDKNKILYGIHD